MSSVLVIGGTGETGLRLIEQALDRGLDVVAVVRSSDKLGPLARRITVVQENVFDPTVIARAASGCSAAISVIGAPAGFLGRGETTVYSRAAAALTTGLPSAGVHRLLFCTSAGVEEDPSEPLPYRLFFKPLFLRRAYDDMTVAEALVRASDLEWTLVRPGRLVNRPAMTAFRVSARFRAPGGKAIGRADVASFILDQVYESSWLHGTPTLTS